MSDLVCDNCTYETDEVNEVGYCQTCARAFSIGYQIGKEGAN